MGHLLIPRKGWQNEQIALFILSKIAFCARPVTVSDDMGSDFFCCLFEIREQKKHREVTPLNSFAIQIKSSTRSFKADNKVSYLSDLELPYFVGVVDQKTLALSIYSGEFLPLLFSKVGRPARLRIDLTKRKVSLTSYYEKTRGVIHVRFPLVAKLAAREDPIRLQDRVRSLQALCRRVQGNISTRRSEEHIYTLARRGGVCIMAGSGSVRVFRENLYKRLAEALYNLEWLLRSRPQDFDVEEAGIYLDTVRRVRKHSGRLPIYVTTPECQLKKLMAEKAVQPKCEPLVQPVTGRAKPPLRGAMEADEGDKPKKRKRRKAKK